MKIRCCQNLVLVKSRPTLCCVTAHPIDFSSSGPLLYGCTCMHLNLNLGTAAGQSLTAVGDICPSYMHMCS